MLPRKILKIVLLKLARIAFVASFPPISFNAKTKQIHMQAQSLGCCTRVKLTFPEFHFETEAKVDFPSACI